MHGGTAYRHLAQLRQDSQPRSRKPRFIDSWILRVFPLLLAAAAILLHSVHQDSVLLRFKVGHCPDHLPGCFRLNAAQGWRYHQPQHCHYGGRHQARHRPHLGLLLQSQHRSGQLRYTRPEHR